ncbi:hypothetical protein BBJ29_006317, partial [Phytophthora kernoviae]
ATDEVFVLAVAATFLPSYDIVSAVTGVGHFQLSKMASPVLIQTIDAADTNRFLRSHKTVGDESDDQYDDLDGDKSGSADDEEITFDVKIAKWRNYFEVWVKNGLTADDIYRDLRVGYYMTKYGRNLGKLSQREEYQKWVTFKVYLEQLKNANK